MANENCYFSRLTGSCVQGCGKWEKSISVKDTSLTNGGHLVEAGVPVVDVAVLAAAVNYNFPFHASVMVRVSSSK